MSMSVKSTIFIYCPAFLKPALIRLENSSIGYRLARGAFWSLAGAVISRGLMLVASIAVARILGKISYGELGIIQSTVGMFGTFAGFGLGLTATKHVAEFRYSDPEKAGRIIGLSTIVSVVTGGFMAFCLFIFAPLLAEHTINASHLAGVLQVGSLLLLLNALNGAQTGALSGFEAFKTIAYINFIVGFSSFPILIGGTYLGGLNGAVWALTANLGINWFLNHMALRKEARKYRVPFTFRKCARELSVLWGFSLPAVLGGVMVAPVSWVCNALLVNQANGYSEMGVYNAVLRIKQVPEMIVMVLMAPLLPMLSEYFGNKDTISYNKMLSYSFALSLCIVVPISLIQVAVPSLTLLPYGSDYQGHISVVQWLMLHAILIGLFQPFSSILTSMNRMWFGFAYNLSWGTVFIALSFLLVSHYGAAGLAAAFALTHLITSSLCVAYIYHFEKAFILDTPIIYYAFSVLFLFGICLIASRYVTPWIAGLVGCVSALTSIVTVLYIKRVRLAWL